MITELPPSHLPIGLLAGIFSNVTASYKYLMIRAILDLAHKEDRISMKEIGLRAISFAWFSIHFYKLSYGSSDKMTDWISGIGEKIAVHELLISDLSYGSIYQILKELESSNDLHSGVHLVLRDFKNYVPYRLLSPWFEKELNGIDDHKKNQLIVELSKDLAKKSLYTLEQEKDDLYVRIHPEWRAYIIENQAFLDGWWRWKFVSFLQSKNPTVLAIPNKLQPPLARNMTAIKKIFKGYFEDKGKGPTCFYTQKPLSTIHHDHFMPWSFLGSDMILNFVPCDQYVNLDKSNSIPSERYLPELARFQSQLFLWLEKKNMKECGEYYRELSLQNAHTGDHFIDRFMSYYKVLYLSAAKQGFSMNWSYEK